MKFVINIVIFAKITNFKNLGHLFQTNFQYPQYIFTKGLLKIFGTSRQASHRIYL